MFVKVKNERQLVRLTRTHKLDRRGKLWHREPVFGIGFFELIVLLFVLVINLIVIIPFWKIFEKAGHPPALSILMVLPVVYLVVLFWFAFSHWPAQAKSGPPGRGDRQVGGYPDNDGYPGRPG